MCSSVPLRGPEAIGGPPRPRCAAIVMVAIVTSANPTSTGFIRVVNIKDSDRDSNRAAAVPIAGRVHEDNQDPFCVLCGFCVDRRRLDRSVALAIRGRYATKVRLKADTTVSTNPG